jgi:hypothetical protein
MLDALLRRVTGPAFDAAARRFSPSAVVVALAGFLVGLGALPVVSLYYYWPGLALLILSRPLAALSAAAVRRDGGTSDFGAVFDAVVFAGIPFAFVLADASRGLAAVFLMFGMVAQLSSAIAFRETRGLIGNLEILVAITIACAFPDRFGIVAYISGVLCFAAAGARLATGIAEGRAS